MKEVLCLATGQTYDLILQTNITAHPITRPYPQVKPTYLVPIKKGGELEFLFTVEEIIECLPNDIYAYQSYLNQEQFERLVVYHEIRKNTFGYGKSNTNYRFYILKYHSLICNSFKKKGIQVSIRLDLADIPLKYDNGLKNPESDNYTKLFEGHLKRVMVNKYERNPIARAKCVEYHGVKCTICGMDFGERYGELGKGFIHVHHLRPLHTIASNYVVDYKNDLISVCPNCHAMIHRIESGENMTVAELKNILGENK